MSIFSALAQRRTLGRRSGRILGAAVTYLLLVVFSAVFLFPLFWMITTSLKTFPETATLPPTWLPAVPQWSNYPASLAYAPLLVFARNSLIICGANVVGTLLSCSLTAYGFSRLKWPGRDVAFIAVLATMMIPSSVTMVPLYIVFVKLNWVSTYYPLTVPAFFGSAFNIFLLRQFFLTIPFEFSEAAVIDGAGELGIFARIILPLAKPALATVALFTFLSHWNDFMAPLIYLNRVERYTLAIGLRFFQTQTSQEPTLQMAASVMATLPIIVLFFLTQRTFIQGIALTGLKG